MNIDSLPFEAHAVATFACMFVLDLVWVFYTKAVVAKAPLRSASWCALLTSMNAVSAVLYVKNPWLIIPAVAGAFAGTFFAMRLSRAEP